MAIVKKPIRSTTNTQPADPERAAEAFIANDDPETMRKRLCIESLYKRSLPSRQLNHPVWMPCLYGPLGVL